MGSRSAGVKGQILVVDPVVIVDVDDYFMGCEEEILLQNIKEAIPDFKVTLFTIVGRNSAEFFSKFPNGVRTWIRLVPHGFLHVTARECQEWGYEQSLRYLEFCERLPSLSRGFKAPGWQISAGMYKALLEKDYWVADQAYNDNRRPLGLKTYVLDSPNKLHFHMQNVCGNGLEESMERILALKGSQFEFIEDNLS